MRLLKRVKHAVAVVALDYQLPSLNRFTSYEERCLTVMP